VSVCVISQLLSVHGVCAHIMVSLQFRKELRLLWHGIPRRTSFSLLKGDGESDREHLGMKHSTELPVECFVPCSCLCIRLFQHTARKCTAVFGQKFAGSWQQRSRKARERETTRNMNGRKDGGQRWEFASRKMHAHFATAQQLTVASSAAVPTHYPAPPPAHSLTVFLVFSI